MKRLLGCLVGCTIGIVAVVSAQRQPTGAGTDPYDGHWRLNPAKTRMFIGEPTTFEDITIWTREGVMDYSLEVARGGHDPAVRPAECTTPAPTRGETCLTRSHYINTYDAYTWSPRLNLTYGAVGGEFITIKVDELTHYRFARGPNHEFEVMMRRMMEDRNEYVAVVMNLDGKVTLQRWFTRLKNGMLVKPNER
jgi:hypothetical protein